MSRHSRKQRIFDTPGLYCICVGGYIDQGASDAFGGMSVVVTRLADGRYVSILTGWLSDQAALAGVLLGIEERGLLLLSAERMDE